MSSRTVASLAAATAIGLAGCRIDFHADTVIRGNGAVERTSRFTVDDEADQRLVEERYALPPGGAWRRPSASFAMAATSATMDAHTYTAVQRVAPRGSITPDYVRRGTGSGVASNAITVTVRPGLWTSTVAYEAVYRDVAEFSSAQQAAQRGLAAWIEYFAAQVEQRVPAASAAQVREAMFAYYRPHLDAALGVIASRGAEALTDSVMDSELGAAFAEDAAVDGIAAQLQRMGPPAHEWRLAIVEAYRAAAELPDLFEPLLQDAAVAGVHESFDEVTLTERVRLPGRVLDHNATAVEDGWLVWTFPARRFLWFGYTLRARSCVIHAGRIAAVTLAVLGLAIVLGRRRRDA